MKSAGPQVVYIHPGLRRQHSLRKLLSTHFEAEDKDRTFLFERGKLRNIQRQGRLPHRGSSRDDIKAPGLETRRDPVKVKEARGNAGNRFLLLEMGLDLLEGDTKDVSYMAE
jgi:hypothetical protein